MGARMTRSLEAFARMEAIDIRRRNIEGPGWHWDDRSVELFWLPIVGPSTVFTWRRLNMALDQAPTYRIDIAELAKSLGLGTTTGRHCPMRRTLARLIDFGFAELDGTTLLVCERAKRLPVGFHRRLPALLQAALHNEAVSA